MHKNTCEIYDYMVKFAYTKCKYLHYKEVVMKKRITVIVLATALLFSLLIFPALAEEYKLGDVNRDGEVTIKDVGMLRLYLADKIDENALHLDFHWRTC